MFTEQGKVDLTLPLQHVADSEPLSNVFSALQKNACSEAEQLIKAAEQAAADPLQVLRLKARHARRCGNLTLAKQLLSEAIEKAQRSSRISDEADDRNLLAFILITRDFDFEKAHTLLWNDETKWVNCPECRLDVAYYKSVWALETGRYQEALRQLDRVLTIARRLDLTDRKRAAQNQQMEVLATLGRTSNVVSLAEEVLADAETLTDPCARAKLETSAAWALMRGPGREERSARVRSIAQNAVERARSQCPAGLITPLVNAAFAEVEFGDLKKARQLLGEAEQHVDRDDRRMAEWIAPLALEVALKEDPATALAKLGDPAGDRSGADTPELEFRRLSTRARALRLGGKIADAQRAYTSAHEALDRWSARVPLGEGRESFFEAQDKWAVESVSFAVSLADAASERSAAKQRAISAVAVEIERNTGRFFYTLTNSERASLADLAQQKRAESTHREHDRKAAQNAYTSTSPGPGVLRIVYHPIQSGWVGVAVSEKGGEALVHIPALPSSAMGTWSNDARRKLSELLLAPFAELIGAARVVEMSALGALRKVPFEALPWKSGVLGDAVDVRYHFPIAVEKRPGCTSEKRALVVIDPSQNLPGAVRSAAHVKQALARMQLQPIELSGSAATKSAVIAELTNPCTSHFHYDGHATFSGRDGAESALKLADEPVGISDILSLPSVPESVSLLGCETAKEEGMGLAHAFLKMGATQVLAATDPVTDTLSHDVAEGLYRLTGPTAQLNLTADFSNAARAARRDNAAFNENWRLFRVFSTFDR